MVAGLHVTCFITVVYTLRGCEWWYPMLFLSLQNGRTSLMIASFTGRADVVCLLIKAHANIHSQEKVWLPAQPVHRHADFGVLSYFMNIGWLYRTSFIITRRPCQSGLYIDGRECTYQPTKQCNVHALTSNIGIFLHVKRLANILPFYSFLLSSLPSLLCCPLHLSSSIPTLPLPPQAAARPCIGWDFYI